MHHHTPRGIVIAEGLLHSSSSFPIVKITFSDQFELPHGRYFFDQFMSYETPPNHVSSSLEFFKITPRTIEKSVDPLLFPTTCLLLM